MEDLIYDVEQQEQQRECEGRTGRCPQCERQGFPILPVRYAVCKNIDANRDIPELPPHRVRDFTEVTLLDALENGEKVEKKINSRVLNHVGSHPRGKVCKYILRQLRPGYFYVFDQYAYDQHMADDNNPPFYWYAYVVNGEGMFHQYSVRETPPTSQEAAFSCMHAPEEERCRKALSASIVTLPRVDKGNVFYCAYTEHPWSREHLSMIEGEVTWRERNMQKFTITGEPRPSSGGEGSQPEVDNKDPVHTFSLDELDLVAELSISSVERKDFVWPAGGRRKLYSHEEMKTSMQDRLSGYAEWLQGQELVIAVNDEVGVIDELNSHRLEPLAELKEFIDTGDNKRMLGILQALDAFEENFKNVQRAAIAERHGDNAQSAYERKLRRDLERMKALKDKAPTEENREYIERVILMLEEKIRREEARRRDRSREDLEDLGGLIEERREQVEDYYTNNKEALDRFRATYARKTAIAEWMTMYFDADYAFWVRDHLKKAFDRYSEKHYLEGSGISGIAGSVLVGGVLSPSSYSLWMDLAKEMREPSGIVPRALFSNNKDLLSMAIDEVSHPEADDYLMPEALEGWVERFREVFEEYDPQIRDEIEQHYTTVFPPLIKTASISLSTLALQSQSMMDTGIDDWRRYVQIFYCSQLEVQNRTLSPLLLMPIETNSAALHQLIDEISVRTQQESGQISRAPIIDSTMPFHDQQGGNVRVPHSPDDSPLVVNFHLPIVNFKDSNIDEVDRQVIDDYESGVFGSSVKAGTTLISLITMKEVSRSERAGHVGKLIVSCVTAIETVRVIVRDINKILSGNGADVDRAKLTSSVVGLFKTLGDAATSYADVRKLPVAGGGSPIDSFWKARMQKIKRLGIIGLPSSVVSVVLGINMINDAWLERDSGQSTGMVVKGVLVGTLTSLGGILAIVGVFVFSGLLTLIGGLITVALLVLGVLFIKLVAQAVYMWIDRSLIGNHVGLVEPFRSAEEELASLELVFRGVTVNIHHERVNIHYQEDGQSVVSKAGGNPYSGMVVANGTMITIKLSVPVLSNMLLDLELASIGEGERTPLSLRHLEKVDSEDVLKESVPTFQIRDISPVSIERSSNDLYSIEFSESYEFLYLKDSVRLYVTLSSDDFDRKTVRSFFDFLVQ
ncbi:T6SS effector BTH_I2691 family protein [Halomonas cupida]|uniref:T6SS effector BTH_I2691 family protein n=1 Tax=Halomonas cupida TaxID=44933 RepID=UPI003EF8A12F